MKVALAIVHAAIIFSCAYTATKNWKSSAIYWSALIVRIVAGFCLGLIYTYYYEASDTWLFFREAKTLAAVGREDLSAYFNLLFDFDGGRILSLLATREMRSAFFIKIISIFCLVSDDNYWVCAAYISLLAFFMSWALHRKIANIFPGAEIASALAFLFFPSIIFWSSGLEKESVALCGVYFLSLVFLMFMTGEKIRAIYWLGVLPATYALWGLKYYWAIVLFMALFTAASLHLAESKIESIKKYPLLSWVAVYLSFGVLLSFSHPNFYLNRFLEVIVYSNQEFVDHSRHNSVIHYINFQESWWSIVINIPWALVSGLFRPVIGEGNGALGLLASVENLCLLILFATSIGRLRKLSRSPMVLATLSYVVVLCVFLALSTPNFGTLSRSRVGFLSFFIFLIAYRNPIFDRVFKFLRREG